MRLSKKRRIAVVQTTELACYRDILRGINSFVGAEGSWEIELFGMNDEFLEMLEDNSFEAALIGPVLNIEQVEKAIKQLNHKVVGVAAQFEERGLPGLVEIESDDFAVGCMAAEHFLNKGFTRFAFLGTVAAWSDLRGNGFEHALKQHGHKVSKLNAEGPVPRDARAWRMPHFGADIVKWITSLPRPLALFVCNDLRGRAISDLCRREDIRIPDDIAILSVDNDDLICDLSKPQLSSIAIPWKKIGFQSCVALSKLLAGEKIPSKRLLIGPECVIERQSTDTLAIDDADVAAALRFIRSHAHEPINVEDILRHVPVARRSLEKRFRELIGRSPLEEIRKSHVDRAKYLLAETDLTMPEIAGKSGFSSAAWFSKAFHDLVGETPTEYRQKFKTK